MSISLGKIFSPITNAGKATAKRAGETRLAKGVLNYDRAESRKLYDEGKSEIKSTLTASGFKGKVKAFISGTAKTLAAYLQAGIGPFYKTAYGKRPV